MLPLRYVLRSVAATIQVLVVALVLMGPADAQELVSFPTSDGGIIYADQYGDGTHAVVLAHGGRFTKESWAVQAEALRDAGLRVLAIDFRGRGRSHGGPGSPSSDDAVHLDVLGAIQYLRNTGAQRISLVGASFGGWAAARAATEAPPGAIDRIVLLAHSPVENPEAIQGRKLFVTTRDDFSGSGTLRLPSIREQYERAPHPKELLILEGSAHAQHIFGTDQGPRLLREILRFLSEPEGAPDVRSCHQTHETGPGAPEGPARSSFPAALP